MKWTYVLIVAACVSSPLYAQTNATLSLQAALQYGLSNSPAARSAQLEIDIARTVIGQAGSLALPQLSAQANYTRLDELSEIDLGEGAIALGSLDNYEISAQVSQVLYAGGQIGAAWRAARIARAYAAANRDAFEAALIFEISRLFYAVLLAREAVEVQQASLEMLQQFEMQARDRKDGGAASEFDALTAQVRVANAKPALIAAQNELALTQAALANAIHYKGEFEVEGTLDITSVVWQKSELELMALQQRQQLQAARFMTDLARENVVGAKSAGRPEVRLFANTMGGNANPFDFSDDWDWRWSAGVTARWNLWDGNLTRQTIRQREIELRQQQYYVAEQESAILLQVKQAWLALQQAQESLAASGESVALAQRALQIAQTRYDAGLSTYLELTDANLALRTAELSRLQAKHDYAVARAQVRFAVGLPSPYLSNPNLIENHAKEPL